MSIARRDKDKKCYLYIELDKIYLTKSYKYLRNLLDTKYN